MITAQGFDSVGLVDIDGTDFYFFGTEVWRRELSKDEKGYIGNPRLDNFLDFSGIL
jgi:hypothetical protein